MVSLHTLELGRVSWPPEYHNQGLIVRPFAKRSPVLLVQGRFSLDWVVCKLLTCLYQMPSCVYSDFLNPNQKAL
jgi:hypothetical protein